MITAARVDSEELDVLSIYRSLGLTVPPQIRMAVGSPIGGTRITDARVSPLQMTVAAASISNGGIRPAPRIALAVRSPLQGWVILPQLGESVPVFSAEAAAEAAQEFSAGNPSLWQWRSTGTADGQTLTWYLAGSQPGGQGVPLVIVVLLEDGDVAAATQIGVGLLEAATRP
jgi:membrane peptidoglycan carboxypeptidase